MKLDKILSQIKRSEVKKINVIDCPVVCSPIEGYSVKPILELTTNESDTFTLCERTCKGWGVIYDETTLDKGTAEQIITNFLIEKENY